MKNPKYFNGYGIPYEWTNLNFIDNRITITTIMTTIKEAKTGENLIEAFAKLPMLHKVWTVDKETETKVRIKHTDALGNVSYIECEKEPTRSKVFTIGDLRRMLDGIPDDIPVFVGCQGYTNYDSDSNMAYPDSETNVVIDNEKMFIKDECAVETAAGII